MKNIAQYRYPAWLPDRSREFLDQFEALLCVLPDAEKALRHILRLGLLSPDLLTSLRQEDPEAAAIATEFADQTAWRCAEISAIAGRLALLARSIVGKDGVWVRRRTP